LLPLPEIFMRSDRDLLCRWVSDTVCGRKSRERGPGLDEGVQGRWVHPDLLQRGGLKHDSGIGFEAFAHHPAEGDAGEGMRRFVGHRTAADVC